MYHFKKKYLLMESEKHITYKDLFKLKSLETAKDKILQKEINNIMYYSHIEQIEYLDSKLKLGLKEHFKSFGEFIRDYRTKEFVCTYRRPSILQLP